MDFEVSYSLENAEQFWDELDDIVAAECLTHEAIDNTLRSFLHFTVNYKDEYLDSDNDIARCSYKLLESGLFKANTDYVRRQIVYGLLQEDDVPSLYMIAAILIYDGRSNEGAFEMLQQEDGFPRLIELVQSVGKGTVTMDSDLHRLLLELLYEMSRIQRLTWEDLSSVSDAFILYLFQMIEGFSDDANDPYHYTIIRVLLVLNEQYMMFSTTGSRITNRVLKMLASHGHSYKTFGENLILLLNREAETSQQLLILKLLYLLFSNTNTAEYFYTNDLRVLLDVILRNLLDLPGPLEDTTGVKTSEALRHTYLRVLHPLLANSQLHRPEDSYKRDEIRKVLRLLGHQQIEAADAEASAESSMSSSQFAHFAPVDSTTLRLLSRCAAVEWLRDEGESTPPLVTVTPASTFPTPDLSSEAQDSADGDSPNRNAGEGEGHKESARRHLLGMSAPQGAESALSVDEMAKQKEKPGVLSPSRARSGLGIASSGQKQDEV